MGVGDADISDLVCIYRKTYLLMMAEDNSLVLFHVSFDLQPMFVFKFTHELPYSRSPLSQQLSMVRSVNRTLASAHCLLDPTGN